MWEKGQFVPKLGHRGAWMGAVMRNDRHYSCSFDTTHESDQRSDRIACGLVRYMEAHKCQGGGVANRD
jgi:hypothetical protein